MIRITDPPLLGIIEGVNYVTSWSGLHDLDAALPAIWQSGSESKISKLADNILIQKCNQNSCNTSEDYKV